MKTKDVTTALTRLSHQSQDIASQHVEELARGIMRRHPRCKEFVMGMGIWCFWDAAGNQVKEAYTAPLNDFIGEWDDTIKITGEPMRFTVDGPKVSNW